tara:strand:+ start:617 stop:778 length:162 start_codon:yes stop_codon:yes gene_type:complete
MIKLLNAYRANPSDKNAERLVAYDDKHPMAKCFLAHEDFADLKKAVQQVKDRK